VVSRDIEIEETVRKTMGELRRFRGLSIMATWMRRGEEERRARRLGHSPYLLSHLAKCSKCGGPYYGNKTKKGGSSIISFAYVCGNYFAKGKSSCRKGSVAMPDLEAKLLEGVRKMYL
jgi:hypothetical protein